MYKEEFYKMAADQDNSLLKGLSIGAGSTAGLAGLVFVNKKLGLVGKLLSKFKKKPELKGIQLIDKPFVKSDFKPGSDIWKQARDYYKLWRQNLPLYPKEYSNQYIGSIYKTLIPRDGNYQSSLHATGVPFFDTFNKAVEEQLNQIQKKLLKNNIKEKVVEKNDYRPTTIFNEHREFVRTPDGGYKWLLTNPHDRPQQKLSKEDRSLLAALIRFTKNKNYYSSRRYKARLSLEADKPQPLSLWETFIQNKPLQLGPYWQYLDGKISRIPQK